MVARKFLQAEREAKTERSCGTLGRNKRSCEEQIKTGPIAA